MATGIVGLWAVLLPLAAEPAPTPATSTAPAFSRALFLCRGPNGIDRTCAAALAQAVAPNARRRWNEAHRTPCLPRGPCHPDEPVRRSRLTGQRRIARAFRRADGATSAAAGAVPADNAVASRRSAVAWPSVKRWRTPASSVRPSCARPRPCQCRARLIAARNSHASASCRRATSSACWNSTSAASDAPGAPCRSSHSPCARWISGSHQPDWPLSARWIVAGTRCSTDEGRERIELQRADQPAADRRRSRRAASAERGTPAPSCANSPANSARPERRGHRSSHRPPHRHRARWRSGSPPAPASDTVRTRCRRRRIRLPGGRGPRPPLPSPASRRCGQARLASPRAG